MRLARGAAAALVSITLLTGCSDGGTANQTLPSTSSTAAETSESLPPLGPANFPVPDEARQQSPEGALRALTYYLDLIPRQSARDGEPLRQLSRGCSFCDFLADRADADASAELTYRGGVITTADLHLPAINGTTAEFAFSASQTAVEILDAGGKSAEGRGQPAVSGLSAAAAMTWDASRRAWLMTQLSFE
jgi:hypothetical protein